MRGFFSLEAALEEIAVLPAVEQCIASVTDEYLNGFVRVKRSEVETVGQKVSQLLYLPILGLTRPRDLYYYQGAGLSVLYGFTYKYLTLEHFLSELTRLEVGYHLAKTVSQQLVWAWYPQAEPLCIYTDWHVKPHWMKQKAHSGQVTMWNRIMPGTKQLLINDPDGHPLLGWNLLIDSHLTHVLVDLEDELATHWGRPIRCNIFDSEGSGVPLAKRYAAADRDYLTVLPLRGDIRLEDFALQSTWETVDGDDTHEAAFAQWRDPLKATIDRQLVLMRPVHHTDPTRIYVGRFGQDLSQGTIPSRFRQRWMCQEQVIRQLVNGANLNANFGYTHQEVENRAQKRRYEAAQQQVERTEQKLMMQQDAVTHRLAQLDEHTDTYQQQYQTATKQINAQHRAVEQRKAKGQSHRRSQQRLQRLQRQQADATTRYQRRQHQCFCDIEKRLYQRRQLAQKLDEQREKRDTIDTQTLCRERELNKDQIMFTLQLLLMNLHQWVLGHYLSPIWQHLQLDTATELIYRKSGRVQWGSDEIHVMLSPYRYPEHQQAMEQTCLRFNAANLRWHDGRRLRISVQAD